MEKLWICLFLHILSHSAGGGGLWSRNPTHTYSVKRMGLNNADIFALKHAQQNVEEIVETKFSWIWFDTQIKKVFLLHPMNKNLKVFAFLMRILQ